MKTRTTPDYVELLEKALFEYVEKYGPTDAVRRLFGMQVELLPEAPGRTPRHDGSQQSE